MNVVLVLLICNRALLCVDFVALLNSGDYIHGVKMRALKAFNL